MFISESGWLDGLSSHLLSSCEILQGVIEEVDSLDRLVQVLKLLPFEGLHLRADLYVAIAGLPSIPRTFANHLLLTLFLILLRSAFKENTDGKLVGKNSFAIFSAG